MSAKLWKLLSSYEWKRPQLGDVEPYQEKWDDEAHKNRARSWSAFASHYINEDPKSYQESAISLESWHDAIHGLVGTGSWPGHMGDPAIAAVSFPIRRSWTGKNNKKLLVRSHLLATPLVSP